MDIPGHHRRRVQAKYYAEKCLEKVFKCIAQLALHLGVVYWLVDVHGLAVTQM